MLKYSEAEVRKMMASISFAIGRFDDNDIDKGLLDAIDLLQGLLEEGRI